MQTVLNDHPFSGYQWVIFALCFFIVLLDGFDTAAIGYIAPSLLGEWGLAKADLAPVLSAALFGFAGAMSSGPLADKFGRKAVLVGSVLVFAVACLASGYTHDLTSDGLALCHRPGPGRCHAQCRDADERVLP